MTRFHVTYTLSLCNSLVGWSSIFHLKATPVLLERDPFGLYLRFAAGRGQGATELELLAFGFETVPGESLSLFIHAKEFVESEGMLTSGELTDRFCASLGGCGYYVFSPDFAPSSAFVANMADSGLLRYTFEL